MRRLSQDVTVREQRVAGLEVLEAIPAPASTLPGAATLLMIHGGAHGAWAFEEWLPCFASRGRRALAVSLRNHGRSRAVPQAEFLRLRVTDYVDDVLAVAAWHARTGHPLALLGHSMGGIVAQKAAERLTLRALVLVAPVPPGQLGPLREPLPRDRPVAVSSTLAREVWFGSLTPERREACLARLVPESPGVINDYSDGHLWVDRQRIRCPVLVTVGMHDLTPLSPILQVAAFYNAKLMKIPDAGHDVMLEPGAARSARRIEGWLREIEAGGDDGQ